MRDERHPQDLRSQFTGLVDRLCDFDAAAFPAASRMDLRFDHNPAGARVEQALGNRNRFVAGRRHLAARHGNSKFLENGLALVLMNFHMIPIPGRNSLAALDSRQQTYDSIEPVCRGQTNWPSVRIRARFAAATMLRFVSRHRFSGAESATNSAALAATTCAERVEQRFSTASTLGFVSGHCF